ncbi:MAG: hypothetical protein AB1348_08070 [Nitrospirota bacterium]
MRKYLTLLVALAMVLGLSGVAMAQLDTKNIQVTATVADYAEITASCSDSIYTLSGAAGATDGISCSASIETNCDASVSMSATRLTNGTDFIDTAYSVTAPNSSANGTFDPDPLAITYLDNGVSIIAKGTYTYSVTGTATLGAISAQAAGNYSATITVTVSSI